MGSSVKLVTKDELTTGNYFNADNLIGGENTTIVKDGDVYKINTSAGESFKFISESNNGITIGEGATYVTVNGYAAREIHIGGGTNQNITIGTADTVSSNVSTSVWTDDFIVHTFSASGGWGHGNIKLYGNITDKNDNEIFGLTSDNAGDNITITGSGSTLKINAAATVSYPHITDSDNVTISVNGSSNTFAFTADNISALNTLVSNSGNYLTQSAADERYASKTELSNKQDQLTPANAGNNITITGEGSSLKINAEATASYPHITDSDNVTISVNGSGNTFAFTADNISSLNTLVSNSGNYLTQSTADERYAKTADLSNKQDQLTSDNAGDNITITGSGSTLKISATPSVNLKFYSEGESSAKIETPNSSFEIGDDGTTLSSAGELNISSAHELNISSGLSTYLAANRVTIGNTGIFFTFERDSIQALNRHIGKDFIHLTDTDWGTMEDGGIYYVDMISDSGPFNFQTGLSMAVASGKVYTAELHIHYNENIDSPVWPGAWQWVDEDDITQPTPVPSGSNGKWICYTVRSVNGFTLVHLDHIYGTAS